MKKNLLATQDIKMQTSIAERPYPQGKKQRQQGFLKNVAHKRIISQNNYKVNRAAPDIATFPWSSMQKKRNGKKL